MTSSTGWAVVKAEDRVFVIALGLGCGGVAALLSSFALMIFVDVHRFRPLVGPETPFAITAVSLCLLGAVAWLVSAIRVIMGRGVRAEMFLLLLLGR